MNPKYVGTMKNETTNQQENSMNAYIVRFAGTPPNNYDAPAPRLLKAESKEAARQDADRLAERDGIKVSSVRKYFGTHEEAKRTSNQQPPKGARNNVCY